MQLRRAGAGGGGKAHRHGQVRVFDGNGLGGVVRLGHTVGDHHGQRLADKMHAAPGQSRPERPFQFHSAEAVKGHAAGHRMPAGRIEVGGGEYAMHPGHGACVFGFDRYDGRVRPVRAQHHGMQLPRQVGVGGVVAAAGEQARIFAAQCGLGHGWVSGRLAGGGIGLQSGRPRGWAHFNGKAGKAFFVAAGPPEDLGAGQVNRVNGLLKCGRKTGIVRGAPDPALSPYDRRGGGFFAQFQRLAMPLWRRRQLQN